MSNLEKKLEVNRPRPVVLVVLDGWGITRPFNGNAITQANTPTMNELLARYPATVLSASGEAVGLPWGEVGNSEVGHINLGLGRILYQDLPRINKAISDNSFFSNPVFGRAIEHVKKNKSKMHLMGLVSAGGVHASLDHLKALIALMKDKGVEEVYIHAFLDGRDTAYNSGLGFIEDLERFLEEYRVGKIATLAGRFYAMDRDNNWERIAKAYLAMTEGEGNKFETATQAIKDSYKKKIYDEEFSPTVIVDKNKKPLAKIEDGDGLIFFNFRSDRAREMTKAFVLSGLEKFARPKFLRDLFFVAMTEYEKDLPVEIAFPTEEIKNTLGETLSNAGLKQLRIAETEKYAHVTYFFNGGSEKAVPGEDHILVPSPRVSSYDLKPEMSAYETTEKLVAEIEKDVYDFILINYANADMVGHTGNMNATIKAVETVDQCLGKIIRAVIPRGGCVLITADHGNAEIIFNMQTGNIDKEHSTSPVPFIIAGQEFEGKVIGGYDAPGGDLSLLQPQGILSDIAPTILKIMNIEKPEEMTGRSLV
jgi:2,3-bisphosphoglycerate-independent phosphoglycerate mutase